MDNHSRYAIADPAIDLCEQVCGGVRSSSRSSTRSSPAAGERPMRSDCRAWLMPVAAAA